MGLLWMSVTLPVIVPEAGGGAMVSSRSMFGVSDPVVTRTPSGRKVEVELKLLKPKNTVTA